MRMVWGCQSCQSNLLTLSYLLHSENDRSLFHSRLSRHIHKFSYSYHTLKKTFDYVWFYCICKYPIREFCTLHYMWYLLMGIFFSWLDGPSLFGNKNVILDEMFQRNASKFALFYVYENPCSFFILCNFIFLPYECPGLFRHRAGHWPKSSVLLDVQ